VLFIGFLRPDRLARAGVVQQSWTAGSHSQSALETPTVVPQAIWLIGLGDVRRRRLVLLAYAAGLAARGVASRTPGPSAPAPPRRKSRTRSATCSGAPCKRRTSNARHCPPDPLSASSPSRLPVAAGLGFLGLGLSGIFSQLPLSLAIGEMAWGTSNNFSPGFHPLLRAAGGDLLRSGMAERMYNARCSGCPGLPGGLMHSNIAACAMFAATSGSSVATAATIGNRRAGEIEKHGYLERLFSAPSPPAARWAS